MNEQNEDQQENGKLVFRHFISVFLEMVRAIGTLINVGFTQITE
jgi:hypothetical protein